MQKFKRTLRGYDPKEVNTFLDDVIGQVEKMVLEKKDRDDQITKLKANITNLSAQIERYKMIEMTLNKTIVAAQDSGEQIRRMAKQESELIINEARKNANRIINEALLRAEKTEYQTNLMRKNISVFKRRLRDMIESQLEIIDDIEVLDI
jgi:cell division initiation protein